MMEIEAIALGRIQSDLRYITDIKQLVEAIKNGMSEEQFEALKEEIKNGKRCPQRSGKAVQSDY